MEGPAGLPTANMLKAQNFFPLDGLSLGHKFRKEANKTSDVTDHAVPSDPVLCSSTHGD